MSEVITTTDITTIVQMVIAILGAACTYVVIPYMKTLKDNANYAQIQKWVTIGVEAAEQTMANATGAEKLEFVTEFLAKFNLSVDEDVLNTMIEAAVLEIPATLTDILADEEVVAETTEEA